MSSAPLLSKGLELAANKVANSAPPYSFKINSSSKIKENKALLPSQVSRVVTKESLQAGLVDVASTISSSPPAAAPNSTNIINEDLVSSSSWFEFSLPIDNEESELLSLPLTSIELPLTPPPLTDGDSFESCAATLLTPVTESDSSAISTAAAIVASSSYQDQPKAVAPAPPLCIRAPPIVSVAASQQQFPVVTPKTPVALANLKPKARARSNSKTSTNKKKVAKQRTQPSLKQRVSPIVHSAPSGPNSVLIKRTMDHQPQQPSHQLRAVPTPMAVATPATAALSAPPRTAVAPTAMHHPQPTVSQGGQPLPPTMAVAGRKYAPVPTPAGAIATSQGVPTSVQYAPRPQQAANRPRAPSNARSAPQAPTNASPTNNNAANNAAANAQTSNTVSTVSITGQVENTGRWTAEEHRLFLQGLEQHGKGWKKIATLIKSRTVVQIRTHAQKYFQKLAKARQSGEPVVGLGNGGGAVGGVAGVNNVLAQGIPIGTAEGDGTIGIAIPMGADGQPVVTMRTTTHATSAHNGNMTLGSDATSLAAAQGQVGIATGGGLPQARGGGRKNRRGGAPGGGTKRRAIGNVVRSAVREGRNVKRQKIAEGKRNGGANKVVSGGGPPNYGVMPAQGAPGVAQVPSGQVVAAPQAAPGSANAGKEEYQVPNPLPSVSNILDPYVTSTMGMPPPPMPAPGTAAAAASAQAKKKGQQRGRQQMAHTATHGTLPMAALEDAVFRLLTPATGAPALMPGTQPHPMPQPSSAIVDPLAPQPQGNKIPVAHTQYHPPNAPPPTGYPQGILPNSSPTGVADMSLLPSWVDAKNPPAWYNEGSDIDTLLEDADCLNWLSDTGDLEETYPPAMAEPAVVSSSSTAATANMNIMEPTPVAMPAVQDPTGGVVHPSTESLSFLVDPPHQQVVSAAHVEDVHQLPAFLEEAATHEQPPQVVASALPYASATEAVEAVREADPTIPEHKLAGVGESDTNLMGFPDLDMGDEQAFVSALLENSGQSTMSFPKLNSELHMHQSNVALNSQSGVALGSVPEEHAANEAA